MIVQNGRRFYGVKFTLQLHFYLLPHVVQQVGEERKKKVAKTKQRKKIG